MRWIKRSTVGARSQLVRLTALGLGLSLVIAACGDSIPEVGGEPTTPAADVVAAASSEREAVADDSFEELPIILNEKTRVLDEATSSALESVSDDGTLTFSGTAAEAAGIETGDVLALGRSEAAPDGVLVVVESVESEGGRLIVRTRPARLDEAFDQLSVDLSQPLNADNFLGFRNESAEALTGAIRTVGVASPGFGVSVARPGSGTYAAAQFENPCQVLEPDGGFGVWCEEKLDFGEGDTSLTITAGFEASMVYEGYLNINWRKGVVSAKSVLTADERAWFYANAQVDEAFDKEVKLPPMNFDLSVVVPPGIPIVVTLTVTPYVYANGSLEAELTFSIDQQCHLAAGGSYKSSRNPKYVPADSRGCEPTKRDLDYHGRAEVAAGVGVEGELSFYRGFIKASAIVEAGLHFWFDFDGVEDDEFDEPKGDVWNLSGCLKLEGYLDLSNLPLVGKEYRKPYAACRTWIEQPNTIPEVVKPVAIAVNSGFEIFQSAGEIEVEADGSVVAGVGKKPELSFSPQVRDSMGQWVSCSWDSTMNDTLPEPESSMRVTLPDHDHFEDPIQILEPAEWPSFPELIPMGEARPCGGGTITLNGQGKRTITLTVVDGPDNNGGKGWHPVTESWVVRWESGLEGQAIILNPTDGTVLDRDEAVALSGTANLDKGSLSYSWTFYYPTQADGTAVVADLRHTTQPYAIANPSSWVPSATSGLTFENPDVGECAPANEFGRLELTVTSAAHPDDVFESDSVVVGFANPAFDLAACGIGPGPIEPPFTTTTLIGPGPIEPTTTTTTLRGPGPIVP